MYNDYEAQEQAALERKKRLAEMGGNGMNNNSRDQLANALMKQQLGNQNANPNQENQKGTKFNRILGSAMMGASMGGGTGWGGLIGGAVGGLAPLAYDYFTKDSNSGFKPEKIRPLNDKMPAIY